MEAKTLSAPQQLRNNICIKAIKNISRGYEKEEDGVPFREGVRICMERPRLLTEAYKETEGEPMVLRRAKALSKILENMTVYIQDGERIVGNFASDPYSVTFYPEFYWRWLEKAVDNGYSGLLSDEDKAELKEINKYWKTRSAHSMDGKYVSSDYWRYNGAMFWVYLFEGGVPNYEKLFKVGLNGIIREIEERLKAIQADKTLHAKDYMDQKDTLEAMIIAVKAVIAFSKRFADRARELASKESREERKKELEEVAAICDWIPGNPPGTLHEALQFFWLIHVITHMIEIGMVGCGVRFDQIMYPFYKKDVQEGRLTREQAQELVEFLFVKCEELGHLHPPIFAGGAAGANVWQTLIVGGVTPEGDDATNEMSYIVLDAAKSMKTLQPPLAVRYHDKIPREFVLSAIDLIRISHAHPSFFNDKAMIPWLLSKKGLPLEDARNYSVNSCMEWNIPGKNMMARTGGGQLMLPKCLELALNQGADKFTGKEIGASTPDPATFTSTQDIMEAFLQQVSFFGERLARMNDLGDALYEKYLPRPLMSALVDGCIERGEDCRKWSYHGKRGISIIGANTVADSLAAIKKLVFEEKRIGLPELLDVLKNNWEGKEDLRQMFISEAPKFGNDDDYVDLMAREVQVRVTEELEKYPGYFGVPLSPEGSVAAMPYAFGFDTGATADGRKDREAFHDGSISPGQGRDKKGPTAVLKSTSKIDPVITYNHLFNQRFMPQFLEGDSREAFAAYLKTWADLGHYHVQFNVVDAEELKDAQESPEKHSDLMVRVCGYAAYFTDLSKGLQDDIIARTEQCF